MKTPAPSAATAPPNIMHIAPGQLLWVCLAPGSILHTIQGEVTIRFAPCIDGHAMASPSRAVLKAGIQWSMEGARLATWVQLGNTSHNPADVTMVESTSEPGLRQQARELLNVIFSRPQKSQKDGIYAPLHASR